MNTTEEAFHNRNVNGASLDKHAPKFMPLSDDRLLLLKDICAKIDPFRPIGAELMHNLEEIGIKDIEDPFKLTNHLLKTLEENINYRRENEQESRATSSKH